MLYLARDVENYKVKRRDQGKGTGKHAEAGSRRKTDKQSAKAEEEGKAAKEVGSAA